MAEVVVPKEAIDRGAVALDDLLTMLGVDPEQRPEHGGPTTAEVLAKVSAEAAAPLILAAELDRLAAYYWPPAEVEDYDDEEHEREGVRSMCNSLRFRAVVLRGEQT